MMSWFSDRSLLNVCRMSGNGFRLYDSAYGSWLERGGGFAIYHAISLRTCYLLYTSADRASTAFVGSTTLA